MIPSIARWFGIVAVLLAAGLFVQAAEPAPAIVPLGENTYRVTISATHKFTRNTDKLKEQALAAASAYCTGLGKQLKIVSVDEKKSMYLMGEMASATLTFQALDLTDPALSATQSAGATNSPVSLAGSAAKPAGNEALYADLLRLDDLRKKGILTDDEFKAEKKKLLERPR